MEALKHSRRQFFTHPWACDSTPPPWLRYCWSREIGPLLATTYNAATDSYASHPLISVVLPVFNGGRYLEAAIASTLKASENFPIELIVVDDGSTDSTPAILNFYHDHPDVRVITQENCGLAIALSQGFKAARGAFLTWTSADNLFLGGALDELTNYLLMNPSAAVAYADVQLIDDSGNPARQTNYRPMDQQPENRSVLNLPADAATLSAWDDNFVNACFLYRRRHAQMVGAYRADLKGYEDFDYWLRLSQFGEVGHIFSSRPLYLYRLHEGSLTSQISAAKLRQQVHQHRVRFLQQKTEAEQQPVDVALSRDSSDVLKRVLARAEAGANLRTTEHSGSQSRLPDLRFVPSDYQFTHQALHSLTAFSNSGSAGYLGRVKAAVTTAASTSVKATANEPLTGEIEITIGADHGLNAPQTHTVLPGVDLPPILRRARSSSFGAIVAPKNCRSVWGILCPGLESAPTSEQKVAWLVDVVANLPQVCFALIACRTDERAFADEVNRRVTAKSRNDNLRIIQLESVAEPFKSEDATLAYTYILSDLDWILSIKTESLSRCLSEVQCELAIAAAAGIGVMFAEIPRTNSSPVDGFSQLNEPPHLAILPLEGFYNRAEQAPNNEAVSRADLSLLRNFQYKTRPHLDHRALEQWISTQAPGRFTHLLRELILARALEAR